MTNYLLYTRFAFYMFLGFLMLFNNCIAQESVKLNTVVIDAGHGGRDPGALGKKSKEKDIVLDVALKVGEYLNEYLPDVEVVYTRDKDVFVPLDKRAKIANESNANLFISIHANSIGTPVIYGAETFTLGNHRTEENLDVAKRENSVIVLEDDYSTKYEDFDPESSESYIIFQWTQSAHVRQSQQVATLIQKQFTQRVGRKDRSVKQAGFLVLREVAMPSVLIELGFLSNAKEEKFIASEKGQVYMASAIFRAIRDYKKEFDSKSNMDDFAQKVAENKMEKITYRIQIASSKKEIKEDTNIYNEFNDLWCYTDNGHFKYTTVCNSDYNVVVNSLKGVREKIKDAFVVAFRGVDLIPVNEALEIQKQ